jgi:hypothetical protein
MLDLIAALNAGMRRWSRVAARSMMVERPGTLSARSSATHLRDATFRLCSIGTGARAFQRRGPPSGVPALPCASG